MSSLISHYDPWLVTVSVLIASLSSFVALDLAKRVRSDERRVALWWGVVGSLAMGSGIWAMHFVGMMAFSVPIALGYGYALTALSWAAAVAASGVALWVASRGRLSPRRLAGGSAAMGGGICAMHYTGMAAIALEPGIRWNGWLVAASALFACVASAAALAIFFWLRVRSRDLGAHGSTRAALWQLAAAVVMGLAISGTHYTGMAAADFASGAVCTSLGALAGRSLGSIVIAASVSLLGLTLLTSMLDARLRDTSMRLAARLQAANAELQQANAALRALAFRDPLTGLANRLQLEERLQHAVLRIDGQRGARHERQCLALLFIDLDGFKPVNDELGHAQGDELLREASARLRSAARADDTVARVGGDEFLVLTETGSSLADAVALADRIVALLARPFEIASRRLDVSASIGIVIYPDNGPADKLLARADAAMYAAKRAGGGGWALFEPHMDAGAAEQLGLQADLRQAIARGELSLHYQPKIDAASGELAGVEALLRWQHPQRGMVSPALFIPVAERFGIVGTLGDWVIDEACRQMAQWAAAGMPMRVAINVSVHQLRQAGLAARIAAALQRHGVAAADLLCEITETAAMDDLRTSQTVFAELLAIGVYLSIDDFGTGHSSLSYLRQLPARQLKIDRSFVGDLETSADARAIVKGVLGLAHALGLRVVAEGVETTGQRDILSQMRCDELQGYLLGRPMPASALQAWCQAHVSFVTC